MLFCVSITSSYMNIFNFSLYFSFILVFHSLLERIHIRVSGTTKWVHSQDCHHLKWSRYRVSFPSHLAILQHIIEMNDRRMTLLMFFYHWRMPFSNQEQQNHILATKQAHYKHRKATEIHRMHSHTLFIIHKYSYHHHHIIIIINVIRIKHRMDIHRVDIMNRVPVALDINIIQVWVLMFQWIWQCMAMVKLHVLRWDLQIHTHFQEFK